ncbi:MAG: hypothetical protein FWE22_01635 [Firmicutes bacterium]|nr:hypothetical protein [Bacillota bacterium]
MNITLTIKDFSSEKLSAFINTVEKASEFKRLVHFSHDEKSHFDRFGYTSKEGKLSIVFDTKARLLTLTASEMIIEKFKPKLELLENLPTHHKSTLPQEKKPTLPQKKPQSFPQEKKSTLPQTPFKSTKEIVVSKKTILCDKENLGNNPTEVVKGVGLTTPKKRNDSKPIGVGNIRPPVSAATNNGRTMLVTNTAQKTADHQPPTAQNTPEYKNGFSLKNYPPEKLNSALDKIKLLKGVFVRVDYATQDATSYTISDNKKNRIYLRYAVKNKSLQIQGKASDLFKEIQLIVYKGTDYKTAVSSYIQQKQSSEDEWTEDGRGAGTDTDRPNKKIINHQPPTTNHQPPKPKPPTQSATNIEKKLKRLIPNAFDYLSEQSKKEFTFALIDIHSELTRLSDYSGLLVSPYRGLERLIYDLQQVKDINVKMIGQGYEKNDDGSYTLKFGYRKKIDSLVYNEVMSALYSEYFEKRNFYLHSDNTLLGEHRRISEKSDAKKIFDNLLTLIDYNCKKLKEIGVGIK